MLRNLIIKNFKSLEELNLQLRPLNVFVGPNNSGKSNIFDGLRFLSELVLTETGALNKRGGFNQIVFNGELEKRKISIGLEGEILLNQEQRRAYRYYIELAGSITGDYRIDKELFFLKNEQGERKLLEFPDPQGMAIAWDESGTKTGGVGAGAHRPYVYHFKDPDRYPMVGRFSNEVQNWSFYNFVPSRIEKPLPVRKDMRVESEGENISTVLHTIQTEHPSSFKEIEDLLRTAVPELKCLYTALTEQGFTYVNIEEKNLEMRINSWAMSDGTLRFLAHLAVVYSPSPPPLVCFEEPENYIHPGLSELVASLLKKASEKTQVLVSTHSPYLLNFLEPADLIIVEKHHGKTEIKKVEEEKKVKEALKVLGLGEMWYAGSFGGVP